MSETNPTRARNTDGIREQIRRRADAMGPGPLTEDGLREHIRPLFSRVLTRDEIYLANHSLGRPLDCMADDVRDALDAWYADMDGAWGPWMAAIDGYRTLMARLIGCARADAVVPKTSAGQGLRAVLNAMPVVDRPLRVIATRGEFDSIDFILKTYAKKGRAEVSWVAPDARGVFHADAIIDALAASAHSRVTGGVNGGVNGGEPADLLVVSQVFFATGQVLDGLDRVIEAAHALGVAVLVDTYHAAGVIEVGFDRLGCEFAVGGNYKYTRGGPGACWLAVKPTLLHEGDDQPDPGGLYTLDTGWFAKKDTFGYHRSAEPLLAAGGDAWLEATPPVLTMYQARAGLELTLALGVDRLRAYSLAQQEAFVGLLGERGIAVADHGARGAFVCVPAVDHTAAVAALKAEGINIDARPCQATGVGLVRFCPDILTTTDELLRAADAAARCIGQAAKTHANAR